ncbi:MAG: cation:proton antiporter [Bacteroidia bacterium]|nr:cation:proton antiporter [Bacteroidia bacterium]MDW8088445.1 cation:proton antiporter [Bacteroidia bacterium]
MTDLGILGALFLGLFSVGWLFQRWRLPELLGFLLLGLLLPRSLLSPDFLQHLTHIGELAIWLLFFFVGLEYSPEHLTRLSRNILGPAALDFALNFGGVALLALLFASPLEALLLGSALYPSSTAVVVRLLMSYGRLANPETELLIGILIVEDLVGITLLGLLSPWGHGGANSPNLLHSFLALGSVLIVFWSLHHWLIPRLSRWEWRMENETLTAFLTFGLVLSVGYLGQAIGLSGALLTFLLGVLLPGDSALGRAAEKTLPPFRELSVGIFFFTLSYATDSQRLSFTAGMGWLLYAIMLKGFSTFWAARWWGLSPRAALRAALSFLPRGEFSLLFGSLSSLWKETISLVIVGSVAVGTPLLAKAASLAERLYPRRVLPKTKLSLAPDLSAMQT